MRIMLLALICACLLPETVYAKPEQFAEGRIIVLPRAGLPEADLKKIVGKARKIGQSDLYIVDVPHGTERGMVARLEHNPHFKFAELDYIVSPDFIPDDPNYINAWHLPNIGAADAWDTAQGAGVTIAILDSGVEGHPDLATRLVPGWNFYDNNSNTADIFGHGTKVAGASAAITNNALGVSGVAGQARIMPIRVAAPTGSAPVSAIASGITWAADRGARIANASFESIAGSASIQNASYYMKSKGGLVTVAAGNGGAALPYAESPALIAVSATDSNNNRASWSSYGPYVDVAAPGVSIATTAMGNTYAWVHGTSFAAPVTAGVIALMMSANPGASNLEIEKVLCSTALDVGPMGRDSYYGCGRIDAAAAVLAVKAATDFDIEAPLISITSPGNDDSVSGLVPVNVSASDNRGVSRVELRVNSNVVAIDGASPFAFTWDSAGTINGTTNLVAYAYDAAGNVAASDPVQVNVANVSAPAPVKDTTPPAVKIINPVAGNVSSNVTVTVNASDNNGAAGLRLAISIDGAPVASGTGSTLSYNWNTRKKSEAGPHVIQVTARDAAGNSATATVSVTVVK
jgi:hypothetical protein